VHVHTSVNKLCFVINTFSFFKSHRLDLITTLAKRFGYEITVITSCAGIDKNDLAEIKDLGIELIHTPQRTELSNIFQYQFRLFRILREKQFDFIIFVTLELSFLGSSLSFLLPRTNQVFMISGLGHHYFRKNIKTYIISALRDFTFNLASRKNSKNCFIFQNSNDLEEFSKKMFLKNHKKYIIHGNGINLEKFSYQIREFEKISFCFSGRCAKTKGIDLILDSFLKLSELNKNIEIDLKLFLLNEDGEDSFSIPKEFLQNKKISFFFNLTEQELISAYENCDIFLLASEREGISRAAQEAAASGMPIIAANNPGTNEVVLDNKNGFLFDLGIKDDLFYKMQKIIDEKSNLKKFSLNSRKLVEENYSLNEVSLQFDRLLKRLKDER